MVVLIVHSSVRNSLYPLVHRNVDTFSVTEGWPGAAVNLTDHVFTLDCHLLYSPITFLVEISPLRSQQYGWHLANVI